MDFNAEQYWNERLTNNFDIVGVGDISMGIAYNKLSYKVTNKILSRIINKYCLDKNANVLDIGSGIGYIVNIWRKNAFKNVTGSDISSFAVEQLKAMFSQSEFYQVDISESMTNFKGKQFNYISCASVLYHIVDDAKWQNALSNIRSAMPVGGKFIFSEGFTVDDLSVQHQSIRNREIYIAALKKAGFKVLKVQPNYILMSDPVGTKSKFFKYWWKVSSKISRSMPKGAYLFWWLVYPVERLLTTVMKKTPGQEFWICEAV